MTQINNGSDSVTRPTAAGPATTGTTATVDVWITDGAMWGDDFNPDDVNRTPWGTADFTFNNCEGGEVALMPNAEMQGRGFADYGYAINRDITVTGIQCPTFTNNALQ